MRPRLRLTSVGSLSIHQLWCSACVPVLADCLPVTLLRLSLVSICEAVGSTVAEEVKLKKDNKCEGQRVRAVKCGKQICEGFKSLEGLFFT